MKNFKTVFFLILFLSGTNCFADGLDTLIEVGRGQAEIQKSYAGETRIYNDVKEAVEDGEIKKGQGADEIRRKYGEPVVNIPDMETGMDKWIYKPAKSSFFKGEKIYLFFDSTGVLAELKKEE